MSFKEKIMKSMMSYVNPDNKEAVLKAIKDRFKDDCKKIRKEGRKPTSEELYARVVNSRVFMAMAKSANVTEGDIIKVAQEAINETRA